MPRIRPLRVVGPKFQCFEAPDLFPTIVLAQDVQARERTVIVPKIDTGMAMTIAPSAIAAMEIGFLPAPNFTLPSLALRECKL
jgi:hypothetical protein